MIIEKASGEDLPSILELQHLAFAQEAESFADYEMLPLKQTVNDLNEEFHVKIFLKALDENGIIIGSTRGYLENGTCYIGMTFVHPDYQGQGVGTRLIRTLETMNQAPRYEIKASIRCPQNIHLYEHLGFVQFRETHTGNKGFVFLEKRNS